MQMSHRKTKTAKPQRLSNCLQQETSTVVLSGFDSIQRGELKHFLQKIPNLVVVDDMTFRVNLVISNTVWSNKYKAAAILGIPIVRKQWALESFKSQVLLQIDGYQLGIFTGVKIGLLGFVQEEYDEIYHFIIDQNGECTQDINDLLKVGEIPTILVLKRNSFTQYESLVKQLGHAACDTDWLQQCKIRQCFVSYHHYLIQKVVSGEIIDKDNLYKELIQPSLEKAFDEQSLNEFDYLSGVVAFINVKEERSTQLIQKYISIGDGHFLSEHLPIVTHIITSEMCQELQKTSAYIVNPLWARDCFAYRTRMVENDYKVYEKPQINRVLFHQDDHPIPKQNSLSHFGLSKGTPFQPNIQLMNKLIDFPRRSFSTNQFSTTPNKSNLFKGLVFYIYDDPKIDRRVSAVIKENGGIVEFFRQNLPQFETKKNNKGSLVVLPDSKETPALAQRLGFSRLISPRWVTYCIEKRKVEMQILEQKLLTLLPTQFETPLKDLKGMEIYVSVKSLDDKVLFKDMVYILTGQQQKSFNSETLGILISDKEQSKKLRFALEKIKSPKWLIQVFQTGKI